MSTSQFMFMFVLFACAFVRPIMLRKCAMKASAESTSVFIGIWTVVGSIIMYPMFYQILHDAVPVIIQNPSILVVGLLKGVAMWNLIRLMQGMRRISNSTVEFSRFVTLGVIACGNMLLGEQLNQWQWMSIFGLTALGFGFAFFGHMQIMSAKQKRQLLTIIIFSATPAMCDQYVLQQVGWYAHYVMVGLGFIGATLFVGTKKQVWKDAAFQPVNIAGGIMWFTTEAIIIAILMTHVPVTMGVMAMNMSVPLVMVLSALAWKEGHWRNQMAFGALGYMIILPMML